MTRSTRPPTAVPTSDNDPGGTPAGWDLDRPPVMLEEFRARALAANPFESDEEIDEFIAWVHAERRQDIA